MSGLTIGLMSIDLMNLEILKNSGSDKERKYAAKIVPLVKQHHFVLVTLLLSNAAAMEALPIFLDRFLYFPCILIVEFHLHMLQLLFQSQWYFYLESKLHRIICKSLESFRKHSVRDITLLLELHLLRIFFLVTFWLIFRFVKFLMIVLFVIAYPIAKLLDLVLGTEHINRFKRQGKKWKYFIVQN